MCGSCHAFTAVATLQGTTAARTGMLFDLSTQQMVDCTRFSPENSSNLGQWYYNWGCDGGHYANNWDFVMDHGSMLESDYPYTSGLDAEETECQHDASSVVSRVADYSDLDGTIEEIHEKLKE